MLEENNTINWSVNTRSVNTTGARVAGGQTREKDTTATLCGNSPGNPKNVCIGELANVQNFYNSGGLALGMFSVSPSRVNGGLLVGGYDPVTGGALDIPNNPVWHATYDPVSFGDPDLRITRQIVGVAAGHEDTDAVNVAQLKALKEWTVQQKFGFYLSAGSGGDGAH
uniref:Trimeric autotransporter adhesin YadA-like stalk domain-containing protein n=1 Tax=Bartonella schoenbuchensis (strain DSM 13525 / NCTC 13165 / R1) TaxID=687861 RepID=E6Z0T3_BARSR|nr:hypothetical protein BARSC_140002 [Bartonella schoenbuchensis R1]